MRKLEVFAQDEDDDANADGAGDDDGIWTASFPPPYAMRNDDGMLKSENRNKIILSCVLKCSSFMGHERVFFFPANVW